MNKKIELLQNWILQRDTREQIVIVLLSFLIIYYILHFIFISPIVAAENTLISQIQNVTLQRTAIEQQFVAVRKIVTSAEFSRLMHQEQQLILQKKNISKKIVNFAPVFVLETQYPQLTKDVIGQLDPSITLISLKEYANQPWNIVGIDRSDKFIQSIYQHKLAIEFKANYFDTITYLSRLEKLPWHLYWDSLEYKVTTYPEADIIVQFYVLSRLKSSE